MDAAVVCRANGYPQRRVTRGERLERPAQCRWVGLALDMEPDVNQEGGGAGLQLGRGQQFLLNPRQRELLFGVRRA